MKKTAHQPNLSTLCLIFSLFIFLLIFSSASIHARRFSPFSMPVGATTTINGRAVIKVTQTGKFVDLAKWNALGNTTMQGWDDCASLATPTGTNFTQGPILTDLRDGKQYEIRKFSDGKCWMVDNLMYGGDTDACAGKTTFAGDGSATPSNQFGTGTYGDCRDPRVGGTAPCTAGSTACGYYYNWQAAMQHETAYYGVTYTGPIINVQGLCPEGWRLPTSTGDDSFQTLHVEAGSPSIGFWQSNIGWKGSFSGRCSNTGGLTAQGTNGLYWTSKQYSIYRSHYFGFSSTTIYTSTNILHPNYGVPIRCLKN